MVFVTVLKANRSNVKKIYRNLKIFVALTLVIYAVILAVDESNEVALIKCELDQECDKY